MRSLGRQGFTLPELLIGLTFLATVGVAITATLRAGATVMRRSLLASTAGQAALTPAAFLRESLANADTTVARLAGPGIVELELPVGWAAPCEVDGVTFTLPREEWTGARLPEAGRDEVRILADPTAVAWQSSTIADVGPADCPDGTPGLSLTLSTPPGTASAVRVVEPVRVRIYSASGTGWWGLAPAGSGVTQPFAGPVLPTGFEFAAIGGELQLLFQPVGGAVVLLRLPLDPG